MKKKNKCKICKKEIKSKIITTRDKSKAKLNQCGSCQFAFLTGNSYKNLSNNKLNQSRLNFKSLKQISIKEDFNNNYLQTKLQYKKFFEKKLKGKRILEVGPSWGALLSYAKKMGIKPYGLEIDKTKCKFINTKLKIECHNNYNYYKKNNFKFKRIFLFYVIEYFYNPADEIKNILDLLDEDGKLIIITPNYQDVLKDVWKSKEYINFFYEKNAKNYFSIKSLKELFKKIRINKFNIYNIQGYSLLNNINWFFNGTPTKSKSVGSDDMNKKLKDEMSKSFNLEKKNINKINLLLDKADKIYKTLCEKNKFGNQIHIEIKKN